MNAGNQEERQLRIDDIMKQHAAGHASLGACIRRLRIEVTGLDQETFAKMCHMSTKALYQIEKDKGNPSLGTLDAILRKFGIRLGMIRSTVMPYSPPLGQQAAPIQAPARGARPRQKPAR